METSEIIQLAILWLVVLLAYWHRDKALYGFAGFYTIFYAIAHSSVLSIPLAFLLGLLGVYSFIKIGESRK